MSWEPEDAEIRRNALALHKAWRAAEQAYDESDEPVGDNLPPEGEAELRAVDADYYARSGALRDEHRAKYDATRAKYAKPASPFKAAADEAERAYMDAPGEALLEDDDGNAVICAKSGFPIWEGEYIFTNDYDGKAVLYEAIGLSPPDDEDLEEAA